MHPSPSRADSSPALERPVPIPDRATGPLGLLVRVRTFEALQYPEYRLLWLGQVCTGLATWMDQVSRGWLMYQLTDSALQLGLVRAVQAVPLLLLSPVAGTLADRYDRKTQIVVSQFIDSLLYGLLAVLILNGQVQPWHVYATALGAAIVQVFQNPSRQALVSESVAPQHLTNAIGLNSMGFNGSRTIGPAVAGGLIAAVDTGGSYVVQALLYVGATYWSFQLRPGSRASAGHPHGRPSIAASTVEGWRFVFHHEAIRTGILVAMVGSLLAQPFTTLLPIYARDILEAGPTGHGLLLTAMGVGAVTGGVLIASIGDALPKGALMLGGLGIYGLCVMAFGVSHWFAVSTGIMVVAGLCNIGVHALIQTIVQGHSPPELRGRMMGAFQQTQVMWTLGSMIAGGLAAAWTAPWALVAMGGPCTACAIAILFAFPRARSIR